MPCSWTETRSRFREVCSRRFENRTGMKTKDSRQKRKKMISCSRIVTRREGGCTELGFKRRESLAETQSIDETIYFTLLFPFTFLMINFCASRLQNREEAHRSLRDSANDDKVRQITMKSKLMMSEKMSYLLVQQLEQYSLYNRSKMNDTRVYVTTSHQELFPPHFCQQKRHPWSTGHLPVSLPLLYFPSSTWNHRKSACKCLSRLPLNFTCLRMSYCK